MRAAIFISGLIRREEDGFAEIKEKILEPNSEHQIDIYLDIWSNKLSKYENKGGSWRQQRREGLSLESHHDLNKIWNLYNPVALAVENDEDAQMFAAMAKKIKNGRKEKSTPYAQLSQFYKLYCVNQLRKSREKALGIKYDLCVRTREELKYPKKILFDNFDIDNKKVFVETARLPGGWTSDKFAICSPEVFDVYSELFLNFLKINKVRSSTQKGELVTAEIYLNHWLKKSNDLEVIRDEKIGKLDRW